MLNLQKITFQLYNKIIAQMNFTLLELYLNIHHWRMQGLSRRCPQPRDSSSFGLTQLVVNVPRGELVRSASVNQGQYQLAVFIRKANDLHRNLSWNLSLCYCALECFGNNDFFGDLRFKGAE